LEQQGRTIRIPSHMMRKISKYEEVVKKLREELDREPTKEEIASMMHLKIKQVRDICKAVASMSALQAFIAGDNKETPSYFTEEDPLVANESKVALKGAIAKLTLQEQDILMLRFGLGDNEPHTLEAIGRKIGLTRERVRQIIKNKILKQLRNDEELGRSV